MPNYKELIEGDIQIVNREIEKANFHIDLFKWVAEKESDKKKKAEILLKVETLKDGIKKNEAYKKMVGEFLAEQGGIKSTFI
jgi:hypothetical protein